MKLKYTGNGDFVVGLPARDLNAAEVRKYGIEKLLKSGLYTEIKRKKAELEKPVKNNNSEE